MSIIAEVKTIAAITIVLADDCRKPFDGRTLRIFPDGVVAIVCPFEMRSHTCWLAYCGAAYNTVATSSNRPLVVTKSVMVTLASSS